MDDHSQGARPASTRDAILLTVARLGGRVLRGRTSPVLVGGLALVVVALAYLQDYGTSVDEWHNSFYGRLFLRTYETGSLLRSPGIDYFNGPFYFMVFTITSRLFQSLNPSWLLTDGLHLTNFLTFLFAAFFLYRLALRILPRRIALLTTALFVSQPVLFGHGFINQKDTPLMAFFVASIEVGLMAAPSLARAVEIRTTSGAGDLPGSPQSRRSKRLAWVWLLVAVLVLGDLWVTGVTAHLARALLAQAYYREGPALLVSLFASVAEDAYKTPLAAYVEKLDRFLFWFRLGLTPALLASLAVPGRILLPGRYVTAGSAWIRRWGPIIAAGGLVGLTTSIRFVGPFAATLVAFSWLATAGRRAVPSIIGYALIAALTTYVTWPALWGDPFGALLDKASQLPEFSRYRALFGGVRYTADSLPWEFLPTLLAVQLTLPVVGLFPVGVLHSLWRIRKPSEPRALLLLLWLWLAVPAMAAVAGLIPMYNNFRHVLFITPPLILIAGVGAERIAGLIRMPILRAALAVASVAPGILGVVRLHPYEYIYYNELAGGVRGAEGRYDLDYWCTAFREAMNFVNGVAAPQARVAFIGGMLSAAPHARQDLRLEQPAEGPAPPDFALACRRDMYRGSFFPDLGTIYEVRADGVLLAVVKGQRQVP